MGFELDVLRGKRPYKWTIWVSHLYYGISSQPESKQLYLGTRYAALLGFILYIIDTDGGKVPCEVRLAYSCLLGCLLLTRTLM